MGFYFKFSVAVIGACCFLGILSQSINAQSSYPLEELFQDEAFTNYTNESCLDPDKRDGFPFPVPGSNFYDRTQYFQCFNLGDEVYYLHMEDCPNNGLFDPDSGACVAETTTNPTTVPTTEEVTSPETTTAEPTTEVTTPEPTTEVTTVETTTEEITTTEVTTEATTVETTTEEVTTTEAPTTEETTTEVTTPETTTEETSVSTPEVTTPTTTLPPRYSCSSEGFFPDPLDETKYYRCIFINNNWYYYVFTCPPNSCYDPTIQLCVVNFCTTTPTTTLAPGPSEPPEFICTEPGNFPDPTNCKSYFYCALLGSEFYKYNLTCPDGSYFDSMTRLCQVGECPVTTTMATTVLPGSSVDTSSSATTTPTTTSEATTTTTTTEATTTTVGGPTTLPPCTAEGNFPNPYKCTAYYFCTPAGSSWFQYELECPPGSYFDAGFSKCITGSCSNAEEVAEAFPVSTTIASSTDPINCMSSGFFRHPLDCMQYYECKYVNATMWHALVYQCPPNTFYSENPKGCLFGQCPIVEDVTTVGTKTTSKATSPPRTTLTTIATTVVTTTKPSTTVKQTTTKPSTTTIKTPGTSTTTTTTTTTAKPTSVAPFECKTAGTFADPVDCRKYYNCISVAGKLFKYELTCPSDSYFSKETLLCVKGKCGN